MIDVILYLYAIQDNLLILEMFCVPLNLLGFVIKRRLLLFRTV